jgi:hypothetical protein
MQQQVEDHSLGSKLFAKNVWVLGSSCFELFESDPNVFQDFDISDFCN